MTRTAAILSTVVIVGCINPAELDDRWKDPEKIVFAASLSIDLTQLCTDTQVGCWNRTASGLFWKDLVVGTGAAAAAGDSVKVHYTVWLPDATVVYTTHAENTPQVLLIGVGLALKGFDEGVIAMRVGGKRRLVLRPSLAYGMAGNDDPRVPPLATLIYEVDLLWTRRPVTVAQR
jgi:FKBP-type peptidyl-prolyl cis-trans isomerase FkpA